MLAHAGKMPHWSSTLGKWLGGEAGTNWDGWLLTVASQVRPASNVVDLYRAQSQEAKVLINTIEYLAFIAALLSLHQVTFSGVLYADIATDMASLCTRPCVNLLGQACFKGGSRR